MPVGQVLWNCLKGVVKLGMQDPPHDPQRPVLAIWKLQRGISSSGGSAVWPRLAGLPIISLRHIETMADHLHGNPRCQFGRINGFLLPSLAQQHAWRGSIFYLGQAKWCPWWDMVIRIPVKQDNSCITKTLAARGMPATQTIQATRMQLEVKCGHGWYCNSLV
jgi:hypothetical protein